MTVRITEDSYVSHLWFIACERSDVVMTLYRENAAESDWRVVTRHRLYGAPAVPGVSDPFTDDDTKHTVESRITGDEEEAVAGLDQVAEALADTLGGELHTVSVRGGAEAFAAALKAQSWAHLRDMGDAS